MKREIEFRAKLKGENFWSYGVPIKTHLGTFIMFEENPHYCSMYGYMEIDEIGLMQEETLGQYTGMIDKNGKKIYEGDIVEFEEWVGYGALKTFKYEVEYDEYSTSFLPMNKYPRCDFEVIGNIYDNPELMSHE